MSCLASAIWFLLGVSHVVIWRLNCAGCLSWLVAGSWLEWHLHVAWAAQGRLDGLLEDASQECASQETGSGSYWAMWGLSPEKAQHQFCRILLFKAFIGPAQIQKGGLIDSISWWRKRPGHIADKHVGWEIPLWPSFKIYELTQMPCCRYNDNWSQDHRSWDLMGQRQVHKQAVTAQMMSVLRGPGTGAWWEQGGGYLTQSGQVLAWMGGQWRKKAS